MDSSNFPSSAFGNLIGQEVKFRHTHLHTTCRSKAMLYRHFKEQKQMMLNHHWVVSTDMHTDVIYTCKQYIRYVLIPKFFQTLVIFILYYKKFPFTVMTMLNTLFYKTVVRSQERMCMDNILQTCQVVFRVYFHYHKLGKI